MGFLDDLKERARKVRVKALEAAGVSRDFIERMLSERGILVPEAAICRGIEMALAGEGAELASCACRPDGVHLTLHMNRYGAHVAFPVRVKIARLVVNAQEQAVEFQVASGRPVGLNLLGKILVPIAGALLSRMLRDRIAASRLVLESHPDENPHRVAIDLSRLGPIRRLKTKIPVLNRSALDVVSVTHAEHVAGGIRIMGTTSRA